MKKKTIKKMLAVVLVLCVLMSTMIPAFAATPFSTIEIFGSEGRCYITVKDNVPLRADPVNTGTVLEKLPINYPLEAEGLFRTKKGTLWVKVKTEQYSEAWIYTGNVELHKTHTYVKLSEFGFEFCNKCGFLRATKADATLVNADAIHIVLAACSVLPVVGNGFDILDGLLSVAEGDYSGALLSFASALPVVGSLGNTIKVTDKAIDVFDGASDTMKAVKATDTAVTALRISENVFLVASKSDSTKLAKNMRKAFIETGKDRFYDCADYLLEKGSIAAHHIVAGGDANEHAIRCRALLAYLGIDINDAENGVFLVKNAKYAADGVVHSGRHSAKYYEIIHNRLFSAYDKVIIPKGASADKILSLRKQAIVKELDNIADILMYTNDIPLY